METLCDFHRDLECPVCFEFYMEKRIVVCTNGHNICSPCYRNLGIGYFRFRCPQCRVSMIERKNNTKLQLAAHRATYPCTCLQRSPAQLMAAPRHLALKCGLTECPYSWRSQRKCCTFSTNATVDEVYRHFEAVHKAAIIEVNQKANLQLFTPNELNVIRFDGNLFYVYRKYEKCSCHWKVTNVLYNNIKYKCEVTLYSSNNVVKVAFQCTDFGRFNSNLLATFDAKIRYYKILRVNAPKFSISIQQI